MYDQNLPVEFPAARRPSLFNLAVEEESLASIPFAVLEQRVGKRIGKLEVSGNKILPDGTEIQVIWQIQGNDELGLPTEQDLDIFVALGVLTFRQNFAKTVTFQGRELARILNIKSVHGKFYDRIKLAMDRFIPLRFRALTQSDRHEEVKWVNVFQEASFSVDRETGRCVGSITWTDKIIRSMDKGFFRPLDARRYMELDGITTKHLYRFLAVAFEKTDIVMIDARILAQQHLGIVNVPKYFSRLMQTLDPVFEQLKRARIVSAWHIVSKADWQIGIRCHSGYVPERRTLLEYAEPGDPDVRRQRCSQLLEKAGLAAEVAGAAAAAAAGYEEFYLLERAAHLLTMLVEEDVMPHVAQAMVRNAIEQGVASEAGRQDLDWIEIGLYICAQKRRVKQPMRNGAGLIVKLVRDVEARKRFVNAALAQTLRAGYRRREQVALRKHEEDREKALIFEYEQYLEAESGRLLEAMTEERRQTARQQTAAQMRHQERYQKLTAAQQAAEVDLAITAKLARDSVPPFEKWRMRRIVRQAILPFFTATEVAEEPDAVGF